MYLVTAPGRICLFGEHMDWCRRAVIPAAIDMRTFLLVENKNDYSIEVRSYPPFTSYDHFSLDNFNPRDGGDLRYVRAVVKAALNRGYNIKGMKLRFIKARRASILMKRSYQDLPVKKGLSSSAAICVATATAIHLRIRGSINLKSPKYLTEIADLAYTGERKILGINCGQMDQYASAYGNLLYIDCATEPPQIVPLKAKLSLSLIIGDTMQEKNTPRILAWLGRRYKNRERDFMRGLEGIVEVVEQARIELSKENPDPYVLGELMNLNQYYLKRYLKVSSDCPISPNNLDKLINAAIEVGALGAKLSGSGGGGCMIAICLKEDEKKIASAIERVGGRVYITQIAREGITFENIKSTSYLSSNEPHTYKLS
ncbi:MAG: hypothetical protein DRJ49_05830 [Thermoprotei archaeon]|nr:MAG: hypothetical protein DRN53_00430 [Thermoprotei archaeon]RLE87882.1 MAG: hypothetical protein DRJ49_05830 [Thermoprotei archaeon]